MKLWAILLLVIPCRLLAAISVSGTVLDATSRMPLKQAVVFVDGSMQFCNADSSGRFLFADSIAPASELIVAAPGYETLVYPVRGDKNAMSFRFEMVRKKMLASTSQPPEKDFEYAFLSILLGNTPNAAETVLTNPSALQYNYDSTSNKLSVSANQLLIFINDGLGYMIHYQLDTFWLSIDEQISSFSGYHYFKNLNTSNNILIRKWGIRRDEAYRGSMLHFMRALSQKQVAQQGFSVRKILSFVEGDKAYKKASQSADVVRTGTVMVDNERKKFVDVPDATLFDIEPLILPDTAAAGNKTLYLAEPVLVEWAGGQQNLQPINGNENKMRPLSLLSFYDKISISKTGAYSPKINLLVRGFMEARVADLLPVEYLGQTNR